MIIDGKNVPRGRVAFPVTTDSLISVGSGFDNSAIESGLSAFRLRPAVRPAPPSIAPPRMNYTEFVAQRHAAPGWGTFLQYRQYLQNAPQYRVAPTWHWRKSSGLAGYDDSDYEPGLGRFRLRVKFLEKAVGAVVHPITRAVGIRDKDLALAARVALVAGATWGVGTAFGAWGAGSGAAAGGAASPTAGAFFGAGSAAAAPVAAAVAAPAATGLFSGALSWLAPVGLTLASMGRAVAQGAAQTYATGEAQGLLARQFGPEQSGFSPGGGGPAGFSTSAFDAPVDPALAPNAPKNILKTALPWIVAVGILGVGIVATKRARRKYHAHR